MTLIGLSISLRKQGQPTKVQPKKPINGGARSSGEGIGGIQEDGILEKEGLRFRSSQKQEEMQQKKGRADQGVHDEFVETACEMLIERIQTRLSCLLLST